MSRQQANILVGALPFFLALCIPHGPFAWSDDGQGKTTQDSPPKKDAPAASKPKHTNRLAKETSPYLLLHAHNPVDWYPWGEEALSKAKREGKVIFLSVGYSSCHWCHVMERESFGDEEIARLLNDHFVCIKVDREERPDIDSIYMTSLQIYNQVSGSGRGGGWPMSMFLTPDCQPFFGGTYFPARDGDRGATIGFLTLLKRVHELWTTKSDQLRQDAETLTKIVRTEIDQRRKVALEPVDAALLAKVLDELSDRYDPRHGGFGYIASQPHAPKFPEPSNLFFLLDRIQAKEVSDAEKTRARDMLIGTLEHMSLGGIRDHLGGGFHRYSVDRFWQIPHFEKMLYDNGQLASIYAEAYQSTGREDFRRVVEELLVFVQREMTHESGAFYSALDADSEDEEGKCYRWEKSEAMRLLGRSDGELFASVYGLNGEPNFEEKYYVPQLSQSLAAIATMKNTTEADLESKLSPIRRKLLDTRSKRPRPLTDTKILASWNGLMIRGYADSGRVLKQPDYVRSAERAADFVLAKMRTKDGRLLRTFGNDQARLNAYLDDYAFVVDGLIALHRATGDRKWLVAAEELTAKQIELFWDDERGGFFFTSDDHESLIARGMDPTDGAEPSGNSVSAQNLLYLSRELNKPDYRKKAQGAIQAVASLLQASPSSSPRLAVAVAEWLRTQPK